MPWDGPGEGPGDPVEVAAGAVADAAVELAVGRVAAQAGVGGVAGLQQVGVAARGGGVDQGAVLAVVHGVAAGAFGDAAVMEGQGRAGGQAERQDQGDLEESLHG